MGNNEFIRQKGNYENLLCYKKAACVFDVTYYFAHKYLQRGDRTIDQMVQAARSGKQNIVEGCAASTTSAETEIKLLNIAKASFHELLRIICACATCNNGMKKTRSISKPVKYVPDRTTQPITEPP